MRKRWSFALVLLVCIGPAGVSVEQLFGFY